VFEAQRTCCEATSFQAKSANAEWDIERNLTVDPSVACVRRHQRHWTGAGSDDGRIGGFVRAPRVRAIDASVP
jgi:hypothetical protein